MAIDAAKALPLDSGSHSNRNTAINFRVVRDMARNLTELDTAVNLAESNFAECDERKK